MQDDVGILCRVKNPINTFVIIMLTTMLFEVVVFNIAQDTKAAANVG